MQYIFIVLPNFFLKTSIQPQNEVFNSLDLPVFLYGIKHREGHF